MMLIMDKNITKKLIEEFLEKLTVQFDTIELIEEEVHPIFLIKTNDSGVLIGNNGENLRALNYLLRKIVGNKTRPNLSQITTTEDNTENTPTQENQNSQEYNKQSEQFLIDVNGYHRRKIQELKNQAQMLGQRAKMFKSNVEMNPMNAYERMIIHSIFTDDAEIETKSEGEGKFRRVVLRYVVNDSQPTVDEELKV